VPEDDWQQLQTVGKTARRSPSFEKRAAATLVERMLLGCTKESRPASSFGFWENSSIILKKFQERELHLPFVSSIVGIERGVYQEVQPFLLSRKLRHSMSTSDWDLLQRNSSER